MSQRLMKEFREASKSKVVCRKFSFRRLPYFRSLRFIPVTLHRVSP